MVSDILGTDHASDEGIDSAMMEATTHLPQRAANAAGIVLFGAALVAVGWLIGISEGPTKEYRWAIVFAPVGIIVLLFLYGAILKRWRWGIYGLIAYMPFSGLPGILLYSYIGTGWASLIKDFLFVIPAYLGFAWWYLKYPERKRMSFWGSRAIVTFMALLAVLVVVHLFNPKLVNLLVGLIGLKVWLFYVPLYFLGYHLIRSKAQLIRISQVLLALGMIPVLYGIAQAVLIYTGRTDLAYALHGPSAEAATQLFARFDTAGGAGLVRVPGLFTFPLQYSSFLLTLLAVAYALWNGGDSDRTHTFWYALALGAVSVALVTSGVRAVYVLLPGYFVLALLLDGRWNQIWKPALALVGLVSTGIGVLVWLLGSTVEDFLGFASNVVTLYLGTSSEGSLLNQFDYALRLTWLGTGTGMNTGAARYAFGSDAGASYISLPFIAGVESFPGKAILEIGVPGLIIAVALLGWLLFSGYRRLRELQDNSLRAFGIGLLCFLIMIVGYLYKGTLLDYDPLNVYFWLFAGILMKLPELEATHSQRLPHGG